MRFMKSSSAERAQEENIARLKEEIRRADSIVIGAGSGLSTSAGFVYTGERFRKYFSDFSAKYGARDMYSLGFEAFSGPEEQWGFFSRFIVINRYMDPPKPVYNDLLSLVKDRDYFVITTNVDHCFQKAGFDKERLFYTQGDFGLFQCSVPCEQKTYDNRDAVEQMVKAQGFVIGEDGGLKIPEGVTPSMRIPSELVPHCPVCGKPMAMNLRGDDTFVEDEGWHAAAARYESFLKSRWKERILFLELGTGMNTPGIIKFPFWQMVYQQPQSVYACVNLYEAFAPDEIRDRSVCVSADIGETLQALRKM